MINSRTPTHFTPSSSMLTAMIERAMSACDADREQAALREQARQDARAERYELAQAAAQRQARTVRFWSGE